MDGDKNGGDTAMSKLVGKTAAIAAKLILTGENSPSGFFPLPLSISPASSSSWYFLFVAFLIEFCIACLGVYKEKGVLRPLTEDFYKPALKLLQEEGVHYNIQTTQL